MIPGQTGHFNEATCRPRLRSQNLPSGMYRTGVMTGGSSDGARIAVAAHALKAYVLSHLLLWGKSPETAQSRSSKAGVQLVTLGGKRLSRGTIGSVISVPEMGA
ncbi:hypothetical protein RhiXN_05075 [Rhizoctonia solani]|uniref:Uncharacterized protein n=1 Tax=Rhizoctonia solani TaxID=456999 RepID=A0A8H8NQW8_9AGAM|nr:uncharacterized protein RhiXN_05075 [Rhizoctonia solani]QRW17073.1 hypothetical protein RhiXN_05075 [Rhizoctonia solani]